MRSRSERPASRSATNPPAQPALIVSIRLTADDQMDLLTACALLEEKLGTCVQIRPNTSAGRRGDWLGYGTLRVDVGGER